MLKHKCAPCDNNTSKNTSAKNIKNKCVKQQIRPENHITGDSVADSPSDINSMVRSEANSGETSEVLPEVPNFDQKDTEIEQQTSIPKFEQNENSEIRNSSENSPLQFEKQNNLSDLFSTDTSGKQLSLNLTSDLINHNSPEEVEHDNITKDNSNSPAYSTKQMFDQSSRESDMKSNEEQNTDIEESVNKEIDTMNEENSVEPLETRKVPKLSLKLPKMDTYSNPEQEDSDESEKMSMEVDQIESENEYCSPTEEKIEDAFIETQIQVAGLEVNIVELELEQPLDKFDIKILLQKCLLATVPICVYCNHARKIAVNGKQLGLHAIAEHRYSAIVNSITAEELIPESFVNRIKESLDDLEKTFFNLESNMSEDSVTFSHVFECFQCRYSTNIHKELYLHNRKMHTKNLLLCIMCKSNFYSYSELICHLCPGDYVLDNDVQFRCCMCIGDDLPSAFRLMVHLRKRHHVCDVCLEMCHNQYKLSNHVWKHKLHHFCYRCGIAYRNKQDITRHLFWKHGTESVMCKKCLQKKWPHVFHFCIPPAVFTCEECNLNFTKAVYLKVHKRIHSNDKPHFCTFEECEEKFVSKKLLQKHEKQHLEPPEEEKSETKEVEVDEDNKERDNEEIAVEESKDEKIEEKPKQKVDVYDLPELNLSESSDSESDNETLIPEMKRTEEEDIIETLDERTLEVEQELANNVAVMSEEKPSKEEEVLDSSVPILESIWDDFKIYQAKKEKIDHMFGEPEKEEDSIDQKEEEDGTLTVEKALRDHDYFYNPETSQDTNIITEVEPDLSQRVDHDYCTPKDCTESKQQEEKVETVTETKKPTSDNSSSDSDSSSCSCGSNCSCSSSSSSSSSSDSSDSDSSTEEGRRKQQARREKKKNRSKNEKKNEQQAPTERKEADNKPILEAPILETDLDTTESETDEEFYDKQPQKLAKKLLEEKRNQILAEVGSLPNGGFFENSRNSTPSLPEEVKPKKKSKSKKRKKKKSERKESTVVEYIQQDTPFQLYQTPTVAPLTISLNKVTPVTSLSISSTPTTTHVKVAPDMTPKSETDLSLRASKRRRVPNKFYGYSSDEEAQKNAHSSAKWRKVESVTPVIPVQTPPLVVPPITIKTGPAQPTVEPITIRPTAKPGELRVHQKHTPRARVPPLQISASLLQQRGSSQEDGDSASDSNESAQEEEEEEEEVEQEDVVSEPPKKAKNVQLYCYCRCPYDEVSEMIGCDSHDCAIEWFHFECVGIMVPPKGQWFCPDCRKRKQQRRELLQV